MLSDIALFITALGVLGVAVGLRQNYLERLQQFEGKYVERYWGILDGLSLDTLRGLCPDVISENDNRHIRSYILLCEDQLEMRKNGYISDSTYDLWVDGIKGQFRQAPFSEVWNQVEEEAGSSQTFPYEHLERLLDKHSLKTYDPLIMAGWRRWVRGLASVRWVRRSDVASTAAPSGSAPMTG